MRNPEIHTASRHFVEISCEQKLSPGYKSDLNRVFCHCSKSVTNLALVDLCFGIVPGCKTTTSTTRIMALMHLSFCGELRLHPHKCQPRMPRRQRSQQQQQESQRCLKLRSHRPRVLLLLQSRLLVNSISPCLCICRSYSLFICFAIF